MTSTTGQPSYHAFISYSRDDTPIATELQRRLERLGRRRSELPSIRVFRDQTDLATTEDLYRALTEHIEASNSFVVLCSPSAATSDFVAAEIEMWRTTKPDRPVVLVLVDGTLHWDHEHGRFDTERSTALPPILVDHFATLPTWIDLPDGADGTGDGPELTDDGVHQVAAVVLDRDLREIRAEEQRIQRRQLLVTRAVAAVVAALAVAAGLAFLDSRRSADEAARQRDIAQSQALAGTAEAIFDEDPDLAMLLAIEADRLAATPESASSLFDVAFRGGDLGQVSWAADESGTFQSAAYNPDEQILFVSLVESTDLLRADFSADEPEFEFVGSPGTSIVSRLGFDTTRGRLYAIEETGAFVTRDGVTGAIIDTDTLGATVAGASVSADGQSFTAVTSTTGQTWEAITGSAADPAAATRTTLPFQPWWVAVSPRGRLATLSGTGEVAVWNPAEGQWTRWLENRIPVTAGFSLDGTQLAVGTRDGGVRLYAVDEMTPSAVGAAAPGQSTPVSFAVTDVPPVGHAGEVQTIVATDLPEGIAFWSVGSDGAAIAWSDDNVVVLGPLTLVHGGTASYARPLPQGGGLLTMGRDSSVQLYRGATGGVVHRAAGYLDEAGQLDPAQAFVALSPRNGRTGDDSTFGVRGDGEAVRIAVAEGEGSAAESLGFNVGPANEVLAMAASADGSRLAVGSRRGNQGLVTVWDLGRGALVGEVVRPGWVTHLDFLDAETLYVTDQVFRGVTAYRVAADGVVALDEFEPPSGQSIAPFPDGTTGFDIGGPDGERVAVAGYGRASEFMVVRDAEVAEYDLAVPLQQVEAVAVNPTGSLAALALSDGRVFLWDLVADEVLARPLDVTQGRIVAMAFYDDETLVTGGRGGWVTLWDVQRGLPIGAPMNPHRLDVTGVTVSPETDSVLTVAIGSAVRWDLDRYNWPVGICGLVGRDLSEAEWRRFLPGREYSQTCGAAG